MSFNPKEHHRRSIRLKNYNYKQPGAYFVTACVQDRQCLLGKVIDDGVLLNEFGKIVADTWLRLPRQYPYVELDEWIVMPNHFHGIVVLLDNDSRGDSRIAPTSEKRKSLGRIIGAFKTVSTKRINELRGIRGMQFWQRNYYEHVIRNERSLNTIRRYIHDNPLLWYLDEDNPRCQNSSPDDMTRAFKKNGFTDEEIHYLHKLKPCLLQPLKSKVFI